MLQPYFCIARSRTAINQSKMEDIKMELFSEEPYCWVAVINQRAALTHHFDPCTSHYKFIIIKNNNNNNMRIVFFSML